jgi:hypothetical protein
MHIGRMRNLYLVGTDHPAPEQARARLDDVARLRVAEVCRGVLDLALNRENPSVWFIRRLEFDLALDLGAADPEAIARLWGENIAQGLLRTLMAGEDGGNVIRFDNRADYLARFIADLAADRAWQQWYYSPMASLRSLPRTAAIRETFLREPAMALAVILRLDANGDLARTASLLSESDANLILAAAGLRTTGPADRDQMEALVEAWRDLERGLRVTPSGFRPLKLAAACGFSPGAHVIAHFLRLADSLGGVRPPGGAAILDDATAAQLAESIAFLGAADGDRAWLDKVARDLSMPNATVARGGAQVIESPFCGLFLLLPAMMEAASPEVLESAPLRFLLALKCLGRSRVPAAWLDAAVWLACGLNGAPAIEELQQAEIPVDDREPLDDPYLSLLGLDPPLVESGAVDRRLSAEAVAVLRSFAAELPGFQKSSFAFVYENFLAGPGLVSIRPDSIEVDLPAVPLSIVLRMSGLEERPCSPPWLNGKIVACRFGER